MGHSTPQRLGLIGRDISYSLSPTIHMTAAEHLGLAVNYELIDLPTRQSVLEFTKRAWDEGYTGFNVTQPWKCLFGDTAINTLYRSTALGVGDNNERWLTTSTDGEGLRCALARSDIDPLDVTRIVCLGNGGVVDAIAASFPAIKRFDCLTRRVSEYTITSNRNLHPWDPSVLKELLQTIQSGVTLLIQATPLPLTGDSMLEFGGAIAAVSINAQIVVVDLCYGVKSDIVAAAQSVGLNTQDGLAMLIEQARLSQTIWWGKSAPYEILYQTCVERLALKGLTCSRSK